MRVSHIIAGACLLLPTASAFVVRAFSEPHCQDGFVEVNVWDNTDATWVRTYRSVVPVAYGGAHQMAYFCTGDNIKQDCWTYWVVSTCCPPSDLPADAKY